MSEMGVTVVDTFEATQFIDCASSSSTMANAVEDVMDQKYNSVADYYIFEAVVQGTACTLARPQFASIQKWITVFEMQQSTFVDAFANLEAVDC